MARFLIVWSVFSVRKWSAQLSWRYRPLTGYGQKAVRRVMRFTPMPLLLLAVRALCRLRLLGRQYRGRSAVATQNYRCLTGVEGRIDAGWIAMRRQLLETGATGDSTRPSWPRCRHARESLTPLSLPWRRKRRRSSLRRCTAFPIS